MRTCDRHRQENGPDLLPARLGHAGSDADLAPDLLPVHLAVSVLYPGTHQHLVGQSFPGRLDPQRRLAPGHFPVARRAADRILLGTVALLFYPKWIYHVSWGDWLPIFEMPLLGY